MNQGNNSNSNGYRKHLYSLLSNKGTKGFALGIGATVAVAALLPTVSKALRPLAVQAAQGAINLSEKALSKGVQLKENIEDIMAEAQYKHHVEKEVAAQKAEEASSAAQSPQETASAEAAATVTSASKAESNLSEVASISDLTPTNGKKNDQSES
ncbi:hypothetical protein [Heliorestis convoluta]|uniref:DUF5132 domain-containing protein n=1 Tax=Heliorestis convoluta TaxID=356322 RepID=A0A5Q2N764_9FIRM|nr:hypothetical protein [Heliorestis convoluta]QGG48385.1 hypothetical protein FTV88_2287 [Heliorestis convoluta]